ncbi:hypothetical protein J6590_003442 [Homalodisca vitripennis]|nr:hypothetical protein J6590_003442 [Homalodisca vitripennis]
MKPFVGGLCQYPMSGVGAGSLTINNQKAYSQGNKVAGSGRVGALYSSKPLPLLYRVVSVSCSLIHHYYTTPCSVPYTFGVHCL